MAVAITETPAPGFAVPAAILSAAKAFAQGWQDYIDGAALDAWTEPASALLGLLDVDLPGFADCATCGKRIACRDEAYDSVDTAKDYLCGKCVLAEDGNG